MWKNAGKSKRCRCGWKKVDFPGFDGFGAKKKDPKKRTKNKTVIMYKMLG